MAEINIRYAGGAAAESAALTDGAEQAEQASAVVISAAALSEKQVAALETSLSAKLDKPVEISCRIDPSVIGGLRIHVDGFSLDRTVKRQLNDMKDNIQRGMANDSQT